MTKPREFVLAWNSQGIIQATKLPEDWTGEVADHALRVREVLPKPREWWIVFFSHGPEPQVRDVHSPDNDLIIEQVHVREVLPES